MTTVPVSAGRSGYHSYCKSNPFVIRQIRLRKQMVLSCVPSKPYLAFNQALSGFQSGLTWNAVIRQQIVSYSPPRSVRSFPASGRGRLLTVKVWSLCRKAAAPDLFSGMKVLQWTIAPAMVLPYFFTNRKLVSAKSASSAFCGW